MIVTDKGKILFFQVLLLLVFLLSVYGYGFALPVADFSGTPTSGIKPLTVQFTDSSTSSVGVITSWSWDFGDTGTSIEQNPSHIYTTAGTYTVTLTVTDSEGSDIETKTGFITVSEHPPVADFSGTPTSGIKPLTVQFTDASTPEGTITGWSWSFGDGSTSMAKNPSHTYSTAGSYTVTLTVTGPGGSDIETKAGYITVNEPPPVADFSGNPTIGMKPMRVQFSDKSTGIITTWSWDFGDGGTSTEQNPAHIYTSLGIYTVTLTVTGPGGSNIMQKVDYIRVTNIIVDHSAGNVILPQVAADGSGHVYAVWEDTRNGSSDIYFNYSTDYGFTWQSSDIRLDTNTPGASNSNSPQIASDNNGHVYVVWKDERSGNSNIYFNYSSDYGATWQSSDKKLSTAPYAPPAQLPKIACDNSGHVYVVWDDNYFNTSADFGANWLTQAIRISTAGGINTQTQLSCDQNGHVYILWRTSDVLFNYSSNYGSNWPNPDTQISDFGAVPYGLSLSSDESGHVYVAWHDGRNNADSPDVYFNSSSDYGNTWGTSDIKLNIGTPGSTYSIWPEVTCDETGHVSVAWYDKRNGLGDIYLNYSSDYGMSLSWQASDKRLDTDSPGSADSGYPEIASDNNGHVYVIWTDDQAGSGPGLYMNYSLDSGGTWLSTNRNIGSVGFNPQMVTDGSRFYMIWHDLNILFNEVAPLEVPPFPPGYPSPAVGATQISLTPTLSWQGGDANLDDTLTYDVYFGNTSPPPIASSNQAGTTYVIPQNLDYFTVYYWQVVARDNSGAETAGPIWSFTTMSGPPQLSNFSPPEGATNIGLLPTLSWTATDPNPGDIITFDVYFGKNNPPTRQATNYTSNTYRPGQLSHYTVYYWKIVARDNHGTETVGPVLSFTTINNPPQILTNSPSNGATGVSLTPTLTWYASDVDGDTIKYDVYFGTSSPPPLVSSNQTSKNYQPGQLVHMTVYYWKIVARDDHGAETELPILSFTTLNHTPEFVSFSPRHLSTGVSVTPTLSWSATDSDPDDTLTYDVYFGASSPPPLVSSDQTETSYQPGQLSSLTRYYWQVVARDHHGAEKALSIMNFTTASAAPQFIDFSPPDGTTGTDPNKPSLSWSASDPDPGDTLTYDVYFGTVSPPPLVVADQIETSYYPTSKLISVTTYYWRIVARDNHEVETASPILSFTTADRPPNFMTSAFSPADLSIDVPVSNKLKWSASDPDPDDTLTYDVYFGTSSPPPLVATNLTTKNYEAVLLPLTTYYWKIVARDSHGVETAGPDLSFTTGLPPPQIDSVSPNPCNTLQIITITGVRFGDPQGSSTLHIGKKVYKTGSARIKVWKDTRIEFKIPGYTTWPHGTTKTLDLWVRVNNTLSNTIQVTVIRP